MIHEGVCMTMQPNAYILHTLRTCYFTVRVKSPVRPSKEILWPPWSCLSNPPVKVVPKGILLFGNTDQSFSRAKPQVRGLDQHDGSSAMCACTRLFTPKRLCSGYSIVTSLDRLVSNLYRVCVAHTAQKGSKRSWHGPSPVIVAERSFHQDQMATRQRQSFSCQREKVIFPSTTCV